ncbi:MAG: hypothetical protein AAF206_11955 [Bacteroidota bacterium]
MSYLKTILLIFILMTGFFLPACMVKDSCDGVTFLNFFDVKGLDIFAVTDARGFDPENGSEVMPNDSIPFDSLERIYIDYQVDYLAENQANWSFSLIPAAYACSFIPGGSGSKEEGLVSFKITTLNDFDTAHPANSSIIDLFDYYGSYYEPRQTPITLSSFLNTQNENLTEEDLALRLNKAPELNPEFKIKVRMELSTGEVYEAVSEPFVIAQ